MRIQSWNPFSLDCKSTSKAVPLGRGDCNSGLLHLLIGAGDSKPGFVSDGPGLEAGGTGLSDLGQTLTPVAGLVGLTQAAQISISNFTGTNPSSSVGGASTQHWVKEINSSYSELCCSQPQLNTGCLFQCRLGSGFLFSE